MLSSSLVHWLFLSAMAVVGSALSSLEYSGAHRSSPLAQHPGLGHPHPMAYAAGPFSSSLAGSHGNMYPEHGYAYSGPVSSASFTRRVHGYNGYNGYPGAQHPGAFSPQIGQMGHPSHHPYGAALGYNYAPAYAPGFAPESGHYIPSYEAYAPTYTPGAMPAYRPAYQHANLYGPGASYAPAYPASPVYSPQTDYAPSQQAIHPFETSRLPTITANKKRSLPVLEDKSHPQTSPDNKQKSGPQK